MNRGTKRLCLGCGAKFYDLERDPIFCPKCGTQFELSKTGEVTEAVKEEPEETPLDTETDEEVVGAEFISLEEAEEEEVGEDIPDMDDIDDVDDGAAQTDDVFLEEDESGSDVSDLIVSVDDDDQG